MNIQDKAMGLKLDLLSESQKIIRGGKNLDPQQAINYAFPNATNYEAYGFKQIGNDLQIKRINYC